MLIHVRSDKNPCTHVWKRITMDLLLLQTKNWTLFINHTAIFLYSTLDTLWQIQYYNTITMHSHEDNDSLEICVEEGGNKTQS